MKFNRKLKTRVVKKGFVNGPSREQWVEVEQLRPARFFGLIGPKWESVYDWNYTMFGTQMRLLEFNTYEEAEKWCRDRDAIMY